MKDKHLKNTSWVRLAGHLMAKKRKSNDFARKMCSFFASWACVGLKNFAQGYSGDLLVFTWCPVGEGYHPKMVKQTLYLCKTQPKLGWMDVRAQKGD